MSKNNVEFLEIFLIFFKSTKNLDFRPILTILKNPSSIDTSYFFYVTKIISKTLIPGSDLFINWGARSIPRFLGFHDFLYFYSKLMAEIIKD